jgi:hypothetical protein
MKVRVAKMVASVPFGHNRIKSFLRRIASEDSILRTCRAERSPLDLIGQLESDRGGIERARASKTAR